MRKRMTAALAALMAGVVIVDQAGWLPPDLADVWHALRDRLGVGPDVGDPGSLNIPIAREMLASVAVEPERRRGYARADWPHWLDDDGDCQDARDEVLIDESVRPVDLDRSGCNVVGGLWLDPFTGRSFTNPRDLDVDHMVPLAEAHRSGGYDWTREQRAAFANDLINPCTLVAVDRGANRAKSDQAPGDWLPPNVHYRCAYVLSWIVVKAEWRLTMDESEPLA